MSHDTENSFLKGEKSQIQKRISEDWGDNLYSTVLIDVASKHLEIRKL